MKVIELLNKVYSGEIPEDDVIAIVLGKYSRYYENNLNQIYESLYNGEIDLSDRVRLEDYEDVWVTASGEELEVSEMTTQHIINCIRMIQKGRILFGLAGDEFDLESLVPIRDEEEENRWINIFKKELERRGVKYDC